MQLRPAHGWGVAIGVLGLALVSSGLEVQDGPPPSSNSAPASTSTEYLADGSLQRRVGLRVLALPSGFTDYHLLPESIEDLDLRGSEAESIDGLPPNLRRLDLRYSRTTRIKTFPLRLEWVDVRATELTDLPVGALPKNLRHLGVDGRIVSGWLKEGHSKFPGELRSLVVYRPPADFLALPLPESLEALGLTQGQVKSLEALPGLPDGLRRLCLQKTDLKDLKGAPETLDELHLLGHASLDGLPPYVTHLELGGDARLDLTKAGRALRFLQILRVSGGKVVGSYESLPLLADWETDELVPKRLTSEVGDLLPWLERLKLVVQPDETEMTDKQLAWLAKRGQDLDLELEIGSLDELRGRQDDLRGLRRLTLKLPYKGGKLPSSLVELNVQLRDEALSGVPSLERLTIRHRGSRTLEALVPAALPDSLVELRIDSNVAGAALPADWIPPPNLQRLDLDGVDLRPWIDALRTAPQKVLPHLQEVVLRRVELDNLDWLPPTVTRLLLLDGHPEEEDGFLDACS